MGYGDIGRVAVGAGNRPGAKRGASIWRWAKPRRKASSASARKPANPPKPPAPRKASSAPAGPPASMLQSAASVHDNPKAVPPFIRNEFFVLFGGTIPQRTWCRTNGCFDAQGDLVGDADAVALEGDYFFGVIGKDAD